MRVQSLSNNLIVYRGKTPSKKNNILEKRAYIQAKTKELDDVCDVMCLGALGTGFFNIDNQGRLQKPSKWCKGFIVAAGVLLALKCVKQIQLSKLYEKENNI